VPLNSLVRRPLWRDWLLWAWLVSLPMGYGCLFLVVDQSPSAPDTRGDWTIQVATFLAVWSAVLVALILLSRWLLLRAEGAVARLVDSKAGLAHNRGADDRP
jgi:hypothetical protein